VVAVWANRKVSGVKKAEYLILPLRMMMMRRRIRFQ
jgi:hypothetical protein